MKKADFTRITVVRSTGGVDPCKCFCQAGRFSKRPSSTSFKGVE
ncbi:hypothetical protein [Cytobacillus pseudoceanisediminis]